MRIAYWQRCPFFKDVYQRWKLYFSFSMAIVTITDVWLAYIVCFLFLREGFSIKTSRNWQLFLAESTYITLQSNIAVLFNLIRFILFILTTRIYFDAQNHRVIEKQEAIFALLYMCYARSHWYKTRLQACNKNQARTRFCHFIHSW